LRRFSALYGTEPVAFLEVQRQAYKQTVEYDLFGSKIAPVVSELLNKPALPFDQFIAFGDALLRFKQLNHGLDTRDDWMALNKAARLDGAPPDGFALGGSDNRGLLPGWESAPEWT
jgi:hypothetical protein